MALLKLHTILRKGKPAATVTPPKDTSLPQPIQPQFSVESDDSEGDAALLPADGPFCRKSSTAYTPQLFLGELIDVCKKLNVWDDLESFRNEGLKLTTPGLNSKYDASVTNESEFLKQATSKIAEKWKLKDEMSEVALMGMLLVLEFCLSVSGSLSNQYTFSNFIHALGYHTVFFWKRAVQLIFDSDMRFGTTYREALLFSLTLYDVNTGKFRLKELFAAAPGLRDTLVGRNAKRFQEAFHHLIQRRSSIANSLSNSVSDLTNFNADLDDSGRDPKFESVPEENDLEDNCSSSASGTRPSYGRQVSSGSGEATPADGTVTSIGLRSTQGHFKERVVTVSNAPPITLKKGDESGEWELAQGSGGLVTCCDPVMSQNPDNMWLAAMGPGVPINSVGAQEGENGRSSPLARPTNSLGLPWIQRAHTKIHMNLLEDPNENEEQNETKFASLTNRLAPVVAKTISSASLAEEAEKSDNKVDINEQMSLLKVLKDYSKDKFTLDPVVVPEDDYSSYYGGISNGLLWPILHNLPEFVLKEYFEDTDVFKSHWRAYVRVNYHFAINAVRTSRPQDFLWIHDYHLLLCGGIIQSLDPKLEVGFFLHIPFQPPEIFFSQFSDTADAVLRALLKFGKVGFQTHRDRKCFLDLVQERLKLARIKRNRKVDRVVVTFNGSDCSVGVFPVSISNEEFLKISREPEMIELARQIRLKHLGARECDVKLFFSVERFDYTKGIKEKLTALDRFFEKYPQCIGKVALFQVAVTNRRSVQTYADYQDNCLAMASNINNKYKSEEHPSWKPVIFQTSGLPRSTLIAHYLAMDFGLVAPSKDGMNLVAKEMVISNPQAGLLLSTGAGTESQFDEAGFYDVGGEQCYYRIGDLTDTESYADTFYHAVNDDPIKRAELGQKLHDFLLNNDIGKWSANFLDPQWSSQVIAPMDLVLVEQFYDLMSQTRVVRSQIVDHILKGLPLRPHYNLSLANAMETLKNNICEQGKHKNLHLKPFEASITRDIVIDVSDEIRELEKDIMFLDWSADSEKFDCVDEFLNQLALFHSEGVDNFHDELEQARELLSKGDHFQYFFTDRDGTLKSYAGTYRSSIQPAYSGVIQSAFAQRCAQYAAIVTTAPLQNVGILDVSVMPDGKYAYGASAGREWYLSSRQKFKDRTLKMNELQLLTTVGDQIELLLEDVKYQRFKWIGSGFQMHYGHITVARQDCFNSIDKSESVAWYDTVCTLVHQFDPTGKLLHIVDAETDIKIHLKKLRSGKVDWDKGRGVRLFVERLKLDLSSGSILIIGDSESDLPMLKEALGQNPLETYTVWVHASDELKARVESMCTAASNSNFVFVSSPEVILGAMARATEREIRVRPEVNTQALEDEEDF